MDNQFRVGVKDAEILISEILKKKVVLKKKQILFLKDYASQTLKAMIVRIVRVPRYCDWVDEGKVFLTNNIL